MSREAQVTLSLLLMAACAATVLAHVPPPPPASSPPQPYPTIPGLLPPGIPGLFPPGIPGLSPPGSSDDRAKCWSSLQGIPGCAWEIYVSVFTGKLAPGPACCKALHAIDENCFAKLLPPFFPPLPKSNCAPGNAAAASEAVGSKQ